MPTAFSASGVFSGLVDVQPPADPDLAALVVNHDPDRWALIASLDRTSRDKSLNEQTRQTIEEALHAILSTPLDEALSAQQEQELREVIALVSGPESLYPASTAGELVDIADGSARLQLALCRAMSDFLIQHAANQAPTFSIILFTAEHHDGAVLASFQSDRWGQVIRPGRDGVADTHLALIPPPNAANAIRRLCAILGVSADEPCVVFMGCSADLSTGFLHRLAARKLSKDTPYPEQLHEIYRTVYASGAIAPGQAGSAVVDKVIAEVKSKPWFWLRAVAAITLGKKGDAAVQLLEQAASGDIEKLIEVRESLLQGLD